MEMELVDEAYTLHCVIVHEGTLVQGHYVAFVQTSPGTWIEFDDARVRRSDVNAVMQSYGGTGNRNAYILMYRKKASVRLFFLFDIQIKLQFFYFQEDIVDRDLAESPEESFAGEPILSSTGKRLRDSK